MVERIFIEYTDCAWRSDEFVEACPSSGVLLGGEFDNAFMLGFDEELIQFVTDKGDNGETIDDDGFGG